MTNFSVFTGDETTISGKVIDYSLNETYLSITLESEETIVCFYYFEDDESFDVSDFYGSELLLTGKMNVPENNTIPNVFNYKDYLYYNNIYYVFEIDEITIVETNFNFKNLVVNKVGGLHSKSYLLMFLLGDKSYLSDEIYQVYQSNGIAHLLAISGLHINLFVLLLEKILKKFKKTYREKFIILFLLFYAYLTNFTVSVLRCIIFYMIKMFSDKFNLKISKPKMLFLTAFLLLLYNPFYIYSAGFLYSFTITYFLLILKPLKKKNYLLSSSRLSVVSFLASLPITININYEINITSIIFNLFFIPYVSFIIFPLSLITFIFFFLDNIFCFFINILEYLNYFCYEHLSLMVNIPKISIIFVLIYYTALVFFLSYKKRYFVFLCLSLFISKLTYKIDSSYYVYYMDIGQGDCNILISPYQSEVIMIDTGGSYYYNVSDNVITFLKSVGITELDLLVISHGDSDHALETENIYESINIKTIMFNENEFNDLEESIKELGIKEVTSVDLKYFTVMNTNENIDSENDASIVLFFDIYSYSFLFTGDIGTDPLTYLVDNFDLSCDFYKVAHHGSKNNSSDYIIESINPTYAFISAGENNVYGHPSAEVIDILENNNVTYYQTLIDGTIKVEITKNDYEITTYPK